MRKLNLTVGHALKAFGQKVGHSKPWTPHGSPLPIPGLEVNNGEDPIEYGLELGKENKFGLPDKPDGVDNQDAYKDSGKPCDMDDVVTAALEKWVFQSLCFISCEPKLIYVIIFQFYVFYHPEVHAMSGQVSKSAARHNDFKNRDICIGYTGCMPKRPCKP